VRGPRNEYAAGGRFNGDVVGSAIAFDIELLDLKSLRVPYKGRRKADPEDNEKSRGQTFGHENLPFKLMDYSCAKGYQQIKGKIQSWTSQKNTAI
jgi:hypothetical protein